MSGQKRFFGYLLLVLLVILQNNHQVVSHPLKDQSTHWSSPAIITRHRRGFDLILGAEHEQNVGTDVSVEALLNVWKSPDENTRVDASATYNQRFGSDNINGNARFGGKLTFHYE